MMEIIDPTAAASSPASVLACSNCASPRLARVGSGGLLQAAAVGDNGTANQQAYAIAVARNLTNPSTTQQSCASTPALADVAQSGTVAVAARQCPNDLSAPAMLFSGTLTKTFANGALETRVAANPGAGAPYVAFLSASGISTGLVDKSTLGTNASSFVASPGTFGLGFDVTPDDAHVWVGYSDMSSNLVIAYGLAGATATKVITPSLATTNVSANQPVSVAATNSDAMIAFSSGTSVHVVRATPTSTTVTTVLTVDGRGPQLAYQPPSAAYPNGVFVLGWVSGSPNPLPTGIGGPTPNVINSAPWWVSFTCP